MYKNHLAVKSPITVCLTGGSGKISYAMLPTICRGVMLGTDQPIHLRLLDIPQAAVALEGVVMEVKDCAFPLVLSITAGTSPEEQFRGADIVIFLGGLPRKQGMERKDLIASNTQIFKEQGEVLNRVAKRTTKCLVIANPANTNCLALIAACPGFPKENFTCLTRLDMNRALWQVAEKANSQVRHVKCINIWGNHSSTLYADVNQATIGGQRVRQFIQDDAWLNTEFLSCVQQRGAEIIKARKQSSAMSAASAAVDHMRDWYLGSNEWVSMGVDSDGSYGVPTGIVFSFPVVCMGNWKYCIVQGLPLDAFSSEKICATTKELLEERQAALGY